MKSDGERLFAAYLRQRRLSWEYERAVNGRHPDFSVDHRHGTFVAEVYEPEMRLPEGGGWFESYTTLRRVFEGRKAKQIRAAKDAGLPYLAVLGATNCDLPLQPLILAGAMFGNLAVTFKVGSDEPIEAEQGRTIFGGGGRVQPRQHRGVSAVAILERFNPTKGRLDAAMDERLAKIPEWRPDMSQRRIAEAQGAIVRIARETEDEFLASGSYDTKARLARLTVLHNPYALNPLDFELFPGPHDAQWGRIEIEGSVGYGELAAPTDSDGSCSGDSTPLRRSSQTSQT